MSIPGFKEKINKLFFLHKKINKRKKELTVATAFANNVFPVPGGPYNKTPLINLFNSIKVKLIFEINK